MKIARALSKIQHYHSVLGITGVAAFLFTKITGRKPLLTATLTGIRHPVYVRVGTTDLSVLKQTLVERHYDFPIPISPKVIIDAGANIGLSAVFFANKYPDAVILALEPDGANFKVLERNILPYPKIKALQAALWSENRPICLLDPGTGDHGFQTAGENNASCVRRGTVQGSTLDALMKTFGFEAIDILKLDIEGAEKEVFENSAQWIEKVDVIMVELHDDLKSGCKRAFSEAAADFPHELSKMETVVRLRAKLFKDNQR